MFYPVCRSMQGCTLSGLLAWNILCMSFKLVLHSSWAYGQCLCICSRCGFDEISLACISGLEWFWIALNCFIPVWFFVCKIHTVLWTEYWIVILVLDFKRGCCSLDSWDSEIVIIFNLSVMVWSCFLPVTCLAELVLHRGISCCSSWLYKSWQICVILVLKTI